MNLENQNIRSGSKHPHLETDLEEFDFKPLTQGLGFHPSKVSEIKPAFVQQPARKTVARVNEVGAPTVYQNDLSLFYGQQAQAARPTVKEEKPVKVLKASSRAERSFAYILDLSLVVSTVALMLTAMARMLQMDLMVAWASYPHEVTPLAVTLFCGFYLIYFSIFESAASSTLGKNLLGLRVVSSESDSASFSILLFRSVVSLLSFVSLGLFYWYDLQNKMTKTKVIRAE